MKTTGCVLDWRGGTRDWSRNHHTLTEHNMIPVRGVNGEARYFNGVDAYIDYGNDSAFDITDALTLEAWIKPIGESMNYGRYLCKANAYHIGQQDADETNIRWELHGLSPGVLNSGTGEVTVGVWNHIVGNYDKNAGGNNRKIYINGIEVASDTHTAAISFSGVDVNIGTLAAASQAFNGTIDNVKIHNRALTPLEIWNNYVTMKPYIPLSESPVAIV